MTPSYIPRQDQDPQQPEQKGQQQGSLADEPTRDMESIRRKIVMRNPVTPPSGYGQVVDRATMPVRQPAALHNPGSSAMSYTRPAVPPIAPAVPEVVNGNVILYRTHNFFLRTVYRPGQPGNPLQRPGGRTAAVPRIMPSQNRLVEASETRVMPSVTLNPGKQTTAIPLPSWLESIMVVIALMGTFAAHAYNMFNFPRYELDEGTYMSYAWAILHGMIASEPYGYGHPPLGWIQIAGWIQLTGGFFTFGTAINSGRVLMLLYALGSALLVYLIVRRMSGSVSAGLLALVIFSFSPLSITYQRQVFLDNIATFWLLLSLFLLVVGNSRLKYLIGSAVCFGVAFLSKETAAIFFPGIVYAAWLYTTKFQHKFNMTAFIYTILAVCSTWVLMAILKGELFPYGWFPWDTHPHLSMLDTFVGQAQRGVESGSLAGSFQAWLGSDPLLIILSIAAPIFNLFYGWWNRKHLMLALLSMLYWLLLVRGGQVLSFYIIMLIPLTAINTAMALNAILSWASMNTHARSLHTAFNILRAVLLLVALAVILPYDLQGSSYPFTQQPTSAQQEAMVWIREHVPRDSFIVINSYLYLDLRLPGGTGVGDSAPFPHAEVYWEVAYDPTLYDTALDKGNWDRIDYIVADSEMLNDIKTYGGPMTLILTAYEHSVLLADFSANDQSSQIVIQIFQVIHKSPAPVVMSSPHSGTSTLVTAAPTQLSAPSNGPPRGDINEGDDMTGFDP